jgi:hypothetical protein
VNEEIEEDIAVEKRVVAAYLARRQEGVRSMIFNDFSATCERKFPPLDKLVKGLRLAVVEPEQPVRVLVEVVERDGELYFQILSSRHPEIKCQPSDPLSILASHIYAERKPAKMGSMRTQFWQLLCQFKKQSQKR